jgi:purine nucleosidase
LGRKILLDTDIGSDVDDALALGLVLASSSDLELVCVTTVAGDTALRARIAARVLGLANRVHVEVCPGEETPLLRRNRFAWYGHEGEGLPPGPEATVSRESAAERMVRAAREHRGLEIVLIGPMTNLARALAIDPNLPERIKGVTVMGGHIRRAVVGRRVLPPGVDYNLCSDPEATCTVLGAGFTVTLVPAEVTVQTWLRPSDLAKLEAGSELAKSLSAMVRRWAPVQRKVFAKAGARLPVDNLAFLHDPMTVLALIQPDLFKFENLMIVPMIQKGVFRTFEVSERKRTPLGTMMRVAVAVKAHRAAQTIVKRLSAL